jgi:hypothetical protein
LAVFADPVPESDLSKKPDPDPTKGYKKPSDLENSFLKAAVLNTKGLTNSYEMLM